MRHFNQQLNSCKKIEHMYTDGSKSVKGVGYSAHSWFRQVNVGLPQQTSVHLAKASATYGVASKKLET
jgi:hypothetical protein